MKAPAFQFYVRDWLLSRSVQKMKGEEVKAYIYLLCESWLEDPRATLPNDDVDLALMAKLPIESWLKVKPRVMANFILRDNRWINEKLAGISATQAKFRKWGEMGGNPNLIKNEPKEVNPPVNPTLKDSVNLASASASASESSNNKREAFTKPTHSEVTEYAKSINFNLDGQYFLDYCDARGWKLKSGVLMKDWRAAVRTWKHNNLKNNGKTSSKPPTASEALKSI